MAWLIQCLGTAGIERQPGIAAETAFLYLADFQPDAGDGEGWVVWTPNVADAMRFASAQACQACQDLTPASRPTKPDGTPNRPLAAFLLRFEHRPGLPSTGVQR
jgi:hypothetical protein